jgi:hypothetical protein
LAPNDNRIISKGNEKKYGISYLTENWSIQGFFTPVGFSPDMTSEQIGHGRREYQITFSPLEKK